MESCSRIARAAVTASLLLLGCVSALHAAPVDGDGFDTVTVTGTRVGDRHELPGSISVIDRAAIEAANATSVLDLLRTVPGIRVTQPGGRGGVASVFIRGGEPEFTMVLLDGIRVNDPQDVRGGSFDFSMIDVDDIERIEIVRGPQSAIYGSDALAGVINFITRARADEPVVTLDGEVDEHGTEHAGLALAGPVGESGGFWLRGATLDESDVTPGNAYTSDSVAGKLSFGSPAGTYFSVFSRYAANEGTSFPADSGGYRLAVLRTLEHRMSRDFTAGIAGGVRLGDGWRFELRASRYERDDGYLSPGVAPGVFAGVPPNGARSTLEQLSLSAYLTGEIGPVVATLGGDLEQVEGSSLGYAALVPDMLTPMSFALEREVKGAFAELMYRPARTLVLSAGVRRDDPDGHAGETTLKLGAQWRIAPRTTVHATWGEGFKLPGFFELGSPLVGNPELRSERSESAELGLTRRFGDSLSATLTAYRSELNDLIDFDFERFTHVNRRSVTVQGTELEAAWAVVPGLELAAEVTYLDLDVEESDQPLRQRPDWRGSLSALWSPRESWLLRTSWSFVGESFDSSVPTGGVLLPAYRRLDVALTWRPLQDLDLLLSADNVLDEEYEEAIGFPAPGRRGRLGFRYRF